MKNLLVLVLFLVSTRSIAAGPAGKTIEYKEGTTELEGYLAETSNKKKKVPGFLIVHDWMGLSDDNKTEADSLAARGAVAMAVDIYGKGVRPTTMDEAGKQATKYKTDRKLLKARIKAAYDVLVSNKKVDPAQIVVLGYCFGGTTALELGRSGVDLAGIVSYHGGLDSPDPKEANNIKGKVLVLHGAIDPFVPQAQVQQFQKEMDLARKDYQLIEYSGAVHAFTNKKAGNDISKGMAYNPVIEARARKQFDTFIGEVVGM